MKKIILVLIMTVLFTKVNCLTVSPQDSMRIAMNAHEQGIIEGKSLSVKDSLIRQIALKDSLLKSCQTSGCNGKPVTGFTWLLVLLPVILLMIVVIFVSYKFKIRDALKENLPITKTIPNPLFDKENSDTLTKMLENPANANNLTPTIQISNDDKSAPSSSRYTAVITVFFGLATIAFFTSAYIYSFIQCPSKPIDLGVLKDVVLPLIVGVLPYGANRLGAGLQGKA